MPVEWGGYSEFEVVVTHEGDRALIRPRGELDIATAERFEAAIAAARSSARSVVIDLGDLSFMDASGVRVLLGAKQALAERLVLRDAAPQVQRLLSLTGAEEQLGFSGRAQQRDEQARANVIYLRELWQAFWTGGAQALAEKLGEQRVSSPAPGAGHGAWGSAELSAFWARIMGGAASGRMPASCRVEEIDSNVLVASEAVESGGKPAVIWSLYFFDGRTFVRAASYRTEAEARAHAKAQPRSS